MRINARMAYIAEISRLGAVFIRFYPVSPEKAKVLRYDRSRSFKVIEIDTNRKPVCDFLLVLHCN